MMPWDAEDRQHHSSYPVLNALADSEPVKWPYNCKMAYIFFVSFQVERIEEGKPGLYRVTASMAEDGTEVVEEYNTVGLQFSARLHRAPL